MLILFLLFWYIYSISRQVPNIFITSSSYVGSYNLFSKYLEELSIESLVIGRQAETCTNNINGREKYTIKITRNDVHNMTIIRCSLSRRERERWSNKPLAQQWLSDMKPNVILSLFPVLWLLSLSKLSLHNSFS